METQTFSKTTKRLKEAFEETTELFNRIKDLNTLHERGEIRMYRKRENIYKENSYPRGIYFILKGKVKTYKTHEQGKDFITGLYKEGDFFGHLALLGEGLCTDSAMALEDSELSWIPKQEFVEHVYNNTEVSRQFIKMLAGNLQEKEEQVIKLAYDSVRKRVANALVFLCNHYKKDHEQQFSINISREDLATLVGIAKETATRTLTDFKDEGLIDIKVKGGNILLNYDKLLEMQN